MSTRLHDQTTSGVRRASLPHIFFPIATCDFLSVQCFHNDHGTLKPRHTEDHGRDGIQHNAFMVIMEPSNPDRLKITTGMVMYNAMLPWWSWNLKPRQIEDQGWDGNVQQGIIVINHYRLIFAWSGQTQLTKLIKLSSRQLFQCPLNFLRPRVDLWHYLPTWTSVQCCMLMNCAANFQKLNNKESQLAKI